MSRNTASSRSFPTASGAAHNPGASAPIDVAWGHDDEMVEGRTVDALRAQHGFSVLVTFVRPGREHRVLFDAGLSANGAVENMRRLELRLDEIETVVLSHGHFDHTGGMHGVAHALGRTNLPLVIHPEGWTRRRLSIPGREPLEMPTPSRQALEGAGFDIVEDREPSLLLDGALLMTGEVERTTEFEHGFPGHEACRNGRWEPDPLVRDDQALVARIRGKGLVILTGCGHSGIVNVVRHVRRVAPGQAIHAIVGGFHLTGPAFEPIIEPTVDALAEFGADYLVPTHCTGFRRCTRWRTGSATRSCSTASGRGWSSLPPDRRPACRTLWRGGLRRHRRAGSPLASPPRARENPRVDRREETAMPGVESRDFGSPDETRTPDKTQVDVVRMGAATAARMVFEPGWRWSECIKPVAGTDSCQLRHVGVVHAGRLAISHEDGTEVEIGPGEAYVIEPGHDAWVVGDERFVGFEFESRAAEAYAKG